MIITLADALREGRGSERPFCCPVHGDSNASASVNVLKGVWVCYACGASGKTEGKAAPSPEDLKAMLEPEAAARHFAEGYLDLFDDPEGYWSTRFPVWVLRMARLGTDPLTGAATFPVRTPQGFLAGVGRRYETGEPRYRYPRAWSASRTLHGLHEGAASNGIVVLVEGAADTVSLWEVGAPALGVYGAGLNQPQVELVMRSAPRLVVLGYDDDEAGHKAAVRDAERLAGLTDTVRVTWPAKDPAATPPEERLRALAQVGLEDYVHQWRERANELRRTYETNEDR